MLELLTFESLAALATLTVMEIVLGIDNVVFIAILAGKLPPPQQPKARRIGLGLALVARIGLLLAINWIMGITAPLFEIFDHTVTGRDIVLILGGGFLIYKATHEIHDKLEGSQETIRQPRSSAKFRSIIMQIIALDLVFSLDSVITAVGMVKVQEGKTWQPIAIMVIAMTLAMVVMMFFADRISAFIEKHPTTKLLALSFLLLIGVVLVAEGLHQHIGKAYIYAAMTFSVFVEVLNIRAGKVAATPEAEKTVEP